jgi:exodeoxyribonuclease V alpha subunit
MNDNAKKIINKKLEDLSNSMFRSSFHLRKYMIKYIDDKGLDKVKKHVYDFINNKLKPANPLNDGKQTPMKGHPVFIAQHATGTCCRGCLEKWHHISKGVELTDNQVNYVVELIMAWINKEYKNML